MFEAPRVQVFVGMRLSTRAACVGGWMGGCHLRMIGSPTLAILVEGNIVSTILLETAEARVCCLIAEVMVQIRLRFAIRVGNGCEYDTHLSHVVLVPLRWLAGHNLKESRLVP